MRTMQTWLTRLSPTARMRVVYAMGGAALVVNVTQIALAARGVTIPVWLLVL